MQRVFNTFVLTLENPDGAFDSRREPAINRARTESQFFKARMKRRHLRTRRTCPYRHGVFSAASNTSKAATEQTHLPAVEQTPFFFRATFRRWPSGILACTLI